VLFFSFGILLTCSGLCYLLISDSYDNIPVDVSGNNIPAPFDDFATLALPDALAANIALCNYSKPTPVQKHALPIGMANRDLMACAQTGSGKTAAFLLPIVAQMLLQGCPELANAGYDPSQRYRKFAPAALVLAPTRELATQIYEQSRKFLYKTTMRSVVVYGGTDIKQQFYDLGKGCQLLVATPGRLVDFMTRGRMTLAACRCVRSRFEFYATSAHFSYGLCINLSVFSLHSFAHFFVSFPRWQLPRV
jgi:ATP-dependent RNA helicase DDX3X